MIYAGLEIATALQNMMRPVAPPLKQSYEHSRQGRNDGRLGAKGAQPREFGS
jgi:hypothetical protein